jgi:hypothetical protein
MNTLLSLNSIPFKTLYSTLHLSKAKDKLDMILEPLQAMVQLAIVGVSPIGTKLTIQENILYIQTPNIMQPISRWMNSDKKDDLYFLFQVIKRYIKWYNPEKNKKSPLNGETYNLISKLSIMGLTNLLKTYGSGDSITLIQVIHMYKHILESNEVYKEDNDIESNKMNIDEVFENITSLYDGVTLNIIYNTLLLIEKEEDSLILNNYIDGLNLISSKKHKIIKEWIKINLMF